MWVSRLYGCKVMRTPTEIDLILSCTQEESVKKPEEDGALAVRKTKKQIAQARLKSGATA
jgi:hypothetical protein